MMWENFNCLFSNHPLLLRHFIRFLCFGDKLSHAAKKKSRIIWIYNLCWPAYSIAAFLVWPTFLPHRCSCSVRPVSALASVSQSSWFEKRTLQIYCCFAGITVTTVVIGCRHCEVTRGRNTVNNWGYTKIRGNALCFLAKRLKIRTLSPLGENNVTCRAHVGGRLLKGHSTTQALILSFRIWQPEDVLQISG